MSEGIKNTSYSGTHFIPLDGLRGLAILLVATGHLFYRFYIFKFGWIGLNLFFLLSGYLITKRLFYHIGSKPWYYFRNFYARRILRIAPLYYGCLLIFFIVLPLFSRKYQEVFGSLYDIQWWYWLYISNWRQVFYGLPPNPLFFHFWSLAVEEQFYLVWPVIFILLRSFKQRLAFVFVLLSVSLLIRIYYRGDTSVYYNNFTAAEPLLMGCLLCILEKKNKLNSIYKIIRTLAFLSTVSLAIILFNNNDLHITNPTLLLVGYLNIDLIWAYLLFILLCRLERNVFIARIFSSRILIWLGIYSYGIYVFHWIVLQLFINKYELWAKLNGFSEPFAYWSTRIAGTVIILVISYMSYHLYERRFLLLKKYFN
jgi:peptidoglycan/LPS O-acetylase OafA/YrhL